jgi:asparagine synthase (glutamine-hydrolysing)
MCGITGVFAFNLVGKFNMIHITAATMSLQKRGPDFQDIYTEENIGLGFRRLAIIDTSALGNQPMWDESKRYCIVFNGEIFNFRELRKELEAAGTTFKSQSDTEVLLQLYIHFGAGCLHRLNGFFAFCIFDKLHQTFFIARDRYGIKPLLYLFDEDKFLFASEMKAILQYGIEKNMDLTSLHTYLQLNYIPAPDTIFTHVKKLLPGHYMVVGRKKMEMHCYYELPSEAGEATDYEDAKKKLKSLLSDSVQQRLVADVPLGAFLSGGVDSSVITALARQHKPDLHTFSIGFRDENFFDETQYARLVANHLQTEHTVFQLTNDDLLAHVDEVLNYLDEPFADSSAINVFILSKETRKHTTVALSGDGADELLGGYNKHAAFYRVLHRGWRERLATGLLPLWNALPQARHSDISNKVRQLKRFADGMKLSAKERYWQWAAFASEKEAASLLAPEVQSQLQQRLFHSRKEEILSFIREKESIHDVLLTDMRLVLPNDMLMKVDLMSMANSLEVRVPFLDVNVVNFIMRLPDDYKINRSIRKRILQDTFQELLPTKLYNRPKKGFEVPLLKWFRKELKSLITDDLLSEKFIQEQGLFNYPAVSKLKRQLFSSNPQDVHARIWALTVFQWWWKKYFKPS